MDFTSHRESLLAHYIALARLAGWKDYAWSRAKDLAREPHGLYADFPQRLTAALTPKPEEKNSDIRSERDCRTGPGRQRRLA